MLKIKLRLYWCALVSKLVRWIHGASAIVSIATHSRSVNWHLQVFCSFLTVCNTNTSEIFTVSCLKCSDQLWFNVKWSPSYCRSLCYQLTHTISYTYNSVKKHCSLSVPTYYDYLYIRIQNSVKACLKRIIKASNLLAVLTPVWHNWRCRCNYKLAKRPHSVSMSR